MAVTEAPLDVLPEPYLLIGSDRLKTASGGEFQHCYPATGKPTRSVPLAGAPEMADAVNAARAAAPAWSGMPADERRNVLLRLADLLKHNAPELSRLQTAENGTPMSMSLTMPLVTSDLFAYNAGWADKIGGEVITTWPTRAFDYSVDEPYGVVALIIPWNGPTVLLGTTAAPALAAGNTVVIKPPELAPFTSLRFGELCLEAGFPPGVVNIVPGGPAGGEALVGHAGVDKVHFTGSGETAKKVMSAALRNLTPVGLELGGKSASLIFADADLLPAVQHALMGIMILAGQGCINGTRILVQAEVYDEVVDLARGVLAQVPVGDPFAETTVIGPVINESAADRIIGVIEAAQRAGSGRLVAGGHRMGGDLADGYFIEPTIFAEVDNRSALAQEEIFGPVLSILRFETEEEAVEMANDTPFGLAGYLHTNNLRRAHRVASALAVGNVWINGFMGIPVSAPFGGTKQSGFGRLGGIAGIREFTRPKNVWLPLSDTGG